MTKPTTTAKPATKKPVDCTTSRNAVLKTMCKALHDILDEIIFDDLPADERKKRLDEFLHSVGNGVAAGRKYGEKLNAGEHVDVGSMFEETLSALRPKAEPLIGVPVLHIPYPELLDTPSLTSEGHVSMFVKTQKGEKTLTIEDVIDYQLNVPGFSGHIACTHRYIPGFESGQITLQTLYGTCGPFHFARRHAADVLLFTSSLETKLAREAKR